MTLGDLLHCVGFLDRICVIPADDPALSIDGVMREVAPMLYKRYGNRAVKKITARLLEDEENVESVLEVCIF